MGSDGVPAPQAKNTKQVAQYAGLTYRCHEHYAPGENSTKIWGRKLNSRGIIYLFLYLLYKSYMQYSKKIKKHTTNIGYIIYILLVNLVDIQTGQNRDRGENRDILTSRAISYFSATSIQIQSLSREIWDEWSL